MSSLKDELKKKYEIKDSIKDYKGYKVKCPEDTINIIETAFDKIGLKASFVSRKSRISRYSSSLFLIISSLLAIKQEN